MKFGFFGGLIIKDNISVEYYCMIFVVLELFYEVGVLWVGSDDGLLYFFCDGGENWSDVMFFEFFEWS